MDKEAAGKNICICRVTKKYGDKTVLSEVERELPIGKITVITGASGSGKTTLLHILAGLLQADSGTITGVPKRVTMVFQENRLIEHLDAVSNVALACKKRYNKDQIIARLADINLMPADVLHKPVREFSGGMRRRVAVARAMLAPGDLCLMDEPLAGLDPDNKAAVLSFIRRHAKGKTVILVSHEEEVATGLSAVLWKFDVERKKEDALYKA